MNKINLWQKKIRSTVIAEYLLSINTNKCVCFSCGNSALFLKEAGLNVVYVGEKASLIPSKWFTFNEISNYFNGLFDATSGHLPFPLMIRISELMKKEMPIYKGKTDILTGSGETIICLKLAYPNVNFKPIREENNPATEFNVNAPLNKLIDIIFKN